MEDLDLSVKQRGSKDGVETWLAYLCLLFPQPRDIYDVPQIPQDDHKRIDPYDELVVLLGTDEGIVIVEE
jgi:hypothetical protein